MNNKTDSDQNRIIFKTAGEENNSQRLDKSIKELFDFTWNKTRKAIETAKIKVNGKIITALDHTVYIGDTIEYREDAPGILKENSFDPKCVVYMDNHLIVADKPADILTVPFEKGDKGTFDQQIRTYLKKFESKDKKKKGALPSLMVVHRLDKLTSGLLVFPRSFAAKEGLAKQFRDHSVKREYLALVHGSARSETIQTHIMPDRGDGIRGSCETSPHPKVRRSQKGQVAITHVEVKKRFKNATLVGCRLETGRTNQIRIHMSEQRCPLIGERTYMRGFSGLKIDSLRLMLHAGELGFIHPITSEPMLFKSELPEHFKIMLKQLEKSS
ncbi:MAG: RluA family pseudouridine synthase [Deltaproteobacteria bacterium]|nr:RluA family pseudouridine synthase [Deltaproteobacteria bacterium]